MPEDAPPITRNRWHAVDTGFDVPETIQPINRAPWRFQTGAAPYDGYNLTEGLAQAAAAQAAADDGQTPIGQYINTNAQATDWGDVPNPDRYIRPAIRPTAEDDFDDFREVRLKAKKDVIKTINCDKETVTAITEIVEQLIIEESTKLEKLFQIRLDSLRQREYTSFLSSYRNDNLEGVAVGHIQELHNEFNGLFSGNIFSSRNWFYGAISDKAKQLYNIDYSKYRYYPRLKATVKYGNPELLAKILMITQVGKGKLVCLPQ